MNYRSIDATDECKPVHHGDIVTAVKSGTNKLVRITALSDSLEHSSGTIEFYCTLTNAPLETLGYCNWNFDAGQWNYNEYRKAI